MPFQIVVVNVFAEGFVVLGIFQKILQVSIDDRLIAIDRRHLNVARVITVLAYHVRLLNALDELLVHVGGLARQLQVSHEQLLVELFLFEIQLQDLEQYIGF